MKDIFGLTVEELQEALQPFSLPKYRARQIAEWMYQRGATGFADMTNLSKKLRPFRLSLTVLVHYRSITSI